MKGKAMNSKTPLCLVALASALVVGCTSVTRESARPMPAWYHAADPAPDKENLYFTGYSEACFSFGQAQNLAEQNARQRVAAYLGTQIMNLLERKTAQSGSDWSASVAPDSVLSSLFRKMPPPSQKLSDDMRSEVTACVNELVRRARVKDLHVETVTVKEGFKAYRRFDAGVLLEFPRSEIERLDRQEQAQAQKTDGLSQLVRQAESLWTAGKKTEAIGCLQAEARRNPMSAEVLVRLAKYQEDAGQTEEALKNYTKAAEQEPADSTWGRTARSSVAALSNRRLAGFLQLASKYQPPTCATLSDGIGWLRSGQVSRARKLFRANYEADNGSLVDLWAWHLAARFESGRDQSMAAQYDLTASAKTISDQIQKFDSPQTAIPAIITLLTFVQQEIEAPAATDALLQIRKKVGPAKFPEEIGSMAVLAMKNSNGESKAEKIVVWLNNQETN